jgi:hypothetical protein
MITFAFITVVYSLVGVLGAIGINGRMSREEAIQKTNILDFYHSAVIGEEVINLIISIMFFFKLFTVFPMASEPMR